MVDQAAKFGVSRPGGIRGAIILLVLIPVFVPLFAAVLIWFSEREAASAASDRVISAARVVGANARLLVESTLERLRLYDEGLGRDPSEFAPRPSATGGNMFIGIYDADGRSVSRGGGGGPSVADSEEFVKLKAGEPWVISPMLGSSETLRLFGIARRIERNGKFAGVLAAYISADTLSTVWGEVGLGNNSTVAMIRKDGRMVTRFPVPAKEVDLSKQPLFTKHLPAAPEGVYVSDSSIVDQIARRVGYVSLTDLGLVTTASIALTTIEDAFWGRVANTSLVAAPIFLALVFLCGWAVLLLRRHDRSRLELQVALDRNRVLFQEVHHRVKNNLQQVVSLIRLQQAPAEMKEDLTRRIAAMSAVHQHIYESDQFGVLDAEAYLARLLNGIREGAPLGVAVEWRLAPLQLSPDQALPLGLIVNEMVSNAFKHGFPNGRAGTVSVVLERPLEGNEAVLTVSDDGVGMSDTPSGGQGLGTRLIAGLAAQLGGKATVTRGDGVRIDLRFPVDKVG